MANRVSNYPKPDFQHLFEAVPGLYLVLLPNSPDFTIVAVSDSYLNATMTRRQEILGCGLFEVFPDNPDDPAATGVSNLRHSLEVVIQSRTPHTMDVQKYDIRRPDSEGGGFEIRYWSPVNSPVLNDNGETEYILHRVENVTEFVRAEEEREKSSRIHQELLSQTNDIMLRAEGLQEANSQLRKIIDERRAAEDALAAAKQLTDRVLDNAIMGVCVLAKEGLITLANPALAAMLGTTVTDLTGASLFLYLSPERHLEVREQFSDSVKLGLTVKDSEAQFTRRDGEPVILSYGWSPLRSDGKLTAMVGSFQDITDRRRLENQLLQAQKLESVGRLAGGVAHDFNNLLTVIMGYAELADTELEPEGIAKEFVSNIRHAADKAANLTRQLLAFARKQIIEPRVTNLNTLILSLDKMLRRLIGENVELVILTAEELGMVRVDPGQFEQIMVNLIVNSRDAIRDTGKITIETSDVYLDEEYATQHDEVQAGDYVLITISDTGEGMDEGIRLHIFEPFFTTKEKGQGTGLGLATVYGIVRQAGGHIWLYSEVGVGTIFKIYLPHTSSQADAIAPQIKASVKDARGTETILLAEDEPSVRSLALHTLELRGYTVIEATNGEEALRLAKGRAHNIDMLITDVIMPQMSGKDLASQLLAVNPSIKVLYASGYTENTIVYHGVLEPGVAFLSKPFTPAVLAAKVRELLDGAEPEQDTPLQ